MPATLEDEDEPAKLWRVSQDIASPDRDVYLGARMELLHLAMTAKSASIQLKACDVLAEQFGDFAVGEALMDSIFDNVVPAAARVAVG